MSSITKWGKKGIWAEIVSSQDHSGEWYSELRIYLREQEICRIGEGEEFEIRGSFDYVESKEVDEFGCPKHIQDNALRFDMNDLMKIALIMDDWINENGSDLYEDEK